MASWKPDVVLDVKDATCPMPLLMAKKALKEMRPGQVLELLGTDPGTMNDLPAFVSRAGDQFLGHEERPGCVAYFVRKG
mgnify:CR=1 FL=1